jgi:hypothetical protein
MITATGETGVGATFTIRLPREGQEVATVLGLGTEGSAQQA